jgi:hypothetical protein
VGFIVIFPGMHVMYFGHIYLLRVRDMTQVVEHLPSKHEAMSSRQVTPKKKKKKDIHPLNYSFLSLTPFFTMKMCLLFYFHTAYNVLQSYSSSSSFAPSFSCGSPTNIFMT